MQNARQKVASRQRPRKEIGSAARPGSGPSLFYFLNIESIYSKGKRAGPEPALPKTKSSFALDTAENPGTFITMNKYKQVFPAGNGAFTFRLTLPAGLKFQAEESWATQEEAAFSVDLLKFYVTKMFKLKGSALLPSLPLADFFKMLRETGIDPANLSDVRFAMSYSTKEMMLNGGHETLAEFVANQKAGWDLPPCTT